ncbi:MAG: IS4 family transposase [Candidatus Bathyarchaeota archaeon]|nr:IS4 family transposase [Candidatus Termiticorpusculum sp.]
MKNIKYAKPSEDLKKVKFGDKRLDNRLIKTVEAIEQQNGSSILSGCGNRHAAKAFYALLSNEKFSKEQVKTEAVKATSKRIENTKTQKILLVQDTCDINLNGHKKTEGLGYCSEHIRGIKVHSCLALTLNGTPLGLIGQQYESRQVKKIGLTQEEKLQRPIEEKESFRWLEMARSTLSAVPDGVETIMLCDREGDFYELYAEMLSLGTLFVVRLIQNRITVDGTRSLQQLRKMKACGEVEVSIPRDTRKNLPSRTVKMEVAFCSDVVITRPKRVKTGLPPSLRFNLVRITEISETSGESIEWLLATNLSVVDVADVMEVVGYYVQRWKIERFHYVLKSGCAVEKIQQRTCERIEFVLLIYSVIAVFILAMTYMARFFPECSCDVFLDEAEWKILYRLVTREKNAPDRPYLLKTAVAYLGELGSYKHSLSDGEYGVKATWKGLIKLFDALDIVDRLMGQV